VGAAHPSITVLVSRRFNSSDADISEVLKFYSRLHGAECVSEVSVRRLRRGSTHLKHLKQCTGVEQMF
jgi:hypothetical protein